MMALEWLIVIVLKAIVYSDWNCREMWPARWMPLLSIFVHQRKVTFAYCHQDQQLL